MLIVCPHCDTSYQVETAALGVEGRDVRCARCRNVWRAMPDDAAMAGALANAADAIGGAVGPQPSAAADPAAEPVPVVDSPSIVSDAADAGDIEWTAPPIDNVAAAAPPRPAARRQRSRFGGSAHARLPQINIKVAILAMGAIAAALIVWRTEVVRLLPQTASFFRMVGLDVNLRSLRFDEIRVASETVDGKPVLVIQGVIVGTGRNAVEVPRLRFVVHDGKGAEIYAWNAILEQATLKFGERAPFRSRLASPPAEAHDIAVRFFSKRDLADGKA